MASPKNVTMPGLSVRILRSPSHDSFSTDLSLISVSSMASGRSFKKIVRRLNLHIQIIHII